MSYGSYKTAEHLLNTIARPKIQFSEQLLLHEFTHRINNEFASAIQVVSSTAARSSNDDVKTALANVLEKLHAYARVHHALQMPTQSDLVDASKYLRELCLSITCSKLVNAGIELILVDQPFRLSAERAWLMGLIISELITNSARHAFDQRGGVIRVDCLVSQESVVCRVLDNGSGSMAQPRNGGGMRIISGLAEALGATFAFNLGEAGAEAILDLPLEAVCLLQTPT